MAIHKAERKKNRPKNSMVGKYISATTPRVDNPKIKGMSDMMKIVMPMIAIGAIAAVTIEMMKILETKK